jgi:hypothetical protein
MRVLIGNTVKTSCADYPFADREQAEAFVMSLRMRDQARGRPNTDPGVRRPVPPQTAPR